MAGLPIAQAPVLDGSVFSRSWYAALQSLSVPSYQKSAGISGVVSLKFQTIPTSITSIQRQT